MLLYCNAMNLSRASSGIDNIQIWILFINVVIAIVYLSMLITMLKDNKRSKQMFELSYSNMIISKPHFTFRVIKEDDDYLIVICNNTNEDRKIMPFLYINYPKFSKKEIRQFKRDEKKGFKTYFKLFDKNGKEIDEEIAMSYVYGCPPYIDNYLHMPKANLYGLKTDKNGYHLIKKNDTRKAEFWFGLCSSEYMERCFLLDSAMIEWDVDCKTLDKLKIVGSKQATKHIVENHYSKK